MLQHLPVLLASLAFIALGSILVRAAWDIYVQGPSRISLVRSVGHGLSAYLNGMLGNMRVQSGWRIMAGWHSKSRNGRTRFSNRCKISDEAV